MNEDEALDYLYDEILCNDDNSEEAFDGFDD